MEYTIRQLAKLAGITTRTLRYYDEIDLLRPYRINASGYRIYSSKEADRLQQILFYRELGMGLLTIRQTLNAASFDQILSLKEHLNSLLDQKKQLDLLITNVTKTIQKEEGRIIMTDQEKFEGFKKQLIEENEQTYGEEIRTAYGNETINQSNEKISRLSAKDYQAMQELGDKINTLLEEAVRNGETPEGKAGQTIAKLHKQWLSYTWTSYTEKAYLGLVQMYVTDQRFTSYYDKNLAGCAAFLKKAVEEFLHNCSA